MKTSEIPCPHCKSLHVIRFGRLRNGYQRYRCRGCTKTFCPEAYWNVEARRMRKQSILAAYFYFGSIRLTARLYNVSRNTLSGWLKKMERPPL